MKKQFHGIVKAATDPTAGSGSAVFATLNKIDLDGDVTLAGAFGEQTAKFCAAHDWKAPNIGWAKIREEGNDAIADFGLYLDMASAKEWHESLKQNFANQIPQELSYGFDVIDSEKGTFEGRPVRFLKKLRVIEVSPVMVGAGIATRVTGIKDQKGLAGSWESTQESLRQAAFELLVPVDAEGHRDGWVSLLGTFRDRIVVSMYLYDGNSDDKFYEFDWQIDGEDIVTLSNQREVALELVVREKSLTVVDHFARVLGATHGLIGRCKALAALRMKEGRAISQERRDRLTAHLETLTNLRADLEKLLAETDPNAENGKAMNLYAQFLRTKAAIAGHIRGEANA